MSHLIQKLRMMNGESTKSVIGETLYLLLPIHDELKATLNQVEELSKGLNLVKFKRAELTPRLPVDMNLRGSIVSHNDVFSKDKRNDPKILQWRYDEPALVINEFYFDCKNTREEWETTLVLNQEGWWVYFSNGGYKTDPIGKNLILEQVNNN